MNDSVQDVYTDELFVGLTRPTTMWGIPYTAFVIEFMATTLVFLAVGNPLYLLLAAPIHGVLYAISASNPKAFDAIFMWLKTIGRCRNGRFWGAASFSPASYKKWEK
ncbi:conjugal transfer protein [Massilia sp. NEAU-DD11]|uniref:Conjugal transfer protein n=1 Tax=Massilia cellulosiltytica TaxID=2683234 RepID=A0A7X3G859_9BURK|nr:type IV secretion system protein VirB3 [Telluria cellulosilytica]MVW64467.1 conjugal transfer protein [Telluria cellulosilytica]